jgi:heme A synthase
VSTSGEFVDRYILEQLERESTRRERLETRCGLLLSSASAIAALMFTALALNEDALENLRDKRLLVWIALFFFGASLIAAILGLLPKATDVPEADDLAPYLNDENFRKPPSFAQERLAEARLSEFRDLTRVTDAIAVRLCIAAGAQALGVVFVGGAIASVL